MDEVEVTFKPSVEKDLRRLPRGVVDRIMKRIERCTAHGKCSGG